MHVGLCFCAKLPRIATSTRVVLVTHRSEDRKSTNTGRLAIACLENAAAVVRGHLDHRAPELPIDDAGEPLLLFPYPDAEPLRASDRPVTLVVPDGTWRQASKVRSRMPALAGVRAVCAPPGPPSRYRLRREAHADRLSTIEAIARALGVLEGDHVQRALEGALDVMVERSLWVKGVLEDAADLPPGATRHDPWSGIS